jgi:hypothetical protein
MFDIRRHRPFFFRRTLPFILCGLALLLTVTSLEAVETFPKPVGAVNDFAGVIPAPYKSRMEDLAREVLDKAGTSVVVATVTSIGDNDAEDYANRLYQSWGVGKKGEDKGVLIFLAVKERRVRIETGYGVEGILPDGLVGEMWMEAFERRDVPSSALADGERVGTGRLVAWVKTVGEIGDDQLLQRCWMAYISDDMPTEAVHKAHPDFSTTRDITFNASLDHTIWFHRPVRADRWHLYDVTCHSYVGGRGLSMGHVFAEDGTHVATIAQEVLVRDTRRKQD